MPAPRRPAPAVLLVIVALPLVTLVAGGWTLAVIGRGGLDTVSDPVRRTAQIQQVDTSGDREAARLGLHAALGRTNDGTSLALDGLQPGEVPDRLWLQLEHPLSAAADQRIALVRDGERWSGPAFDVVPGWRVAVTPGDGRWRLVGRWPRGGQRLALRPALEADPEHTDGAR